MKQFEGKFRLELGEPRVIVQGAPGDQAWGHYQFPSLHRSVNGGILAYWSYGEDSIEGGSHEGGKKPPYVSYDNGETWSPNTAGDTPAHRWVMPDGKVFLGFCGRGAHPVPAEWWDQYTHGTTWYDNYYKGDFHMYFAEDMEKNDDTVVRARILDPKTGETETYEPTIIWPHAPIVRYPGDRIYPLTNVFALSSGSIILRDGVFYMCLYMYGFDSTAATREEAAALDCHKYSVYVFTSEDCARTWTFRSQVSADLGTEGFCEPKMDRMPDGSFVMLMRTGGIHPSYITRSADNCRSWSKPVQFDECGVLPQVLTLPCGVTLAGYGRPKLRLRATADPAGIEWEEPITIPLVDPEGNTNAYRTNVSCFYTGFLPLTDTSALWIYSEFLRPNENGEPAKSVIARKITVVED